MLFYISAFGLWAPPALISGNGSRKFKLTQHSIGSQICARETCYLYRLECGAGVCFVWVGGISNPELYRLEIACCGAPGEVVVVECVGAGGLCVVVCGARAAAGADVFAGDVGFMSWDCGS